MNKDSDTFILNFLLNYERLLAKFMKLQADIKF